MRLIDADTLIESMAIENAVKWGNKDGYQQDHSYSTLMRYEIKNEIDAQPTVDAVPLDKLCEWLTSNFAEPPCCVLENVQCKMECRGFTQMDYSECWRYVLTKWMEGLDADKLLGVGK